MARGRSAVRFPEGERLVRRFVLAAIALVVTLGVTIIAPHAEVRIQVIGQPAVQTFAVQFDSGLSRVDQILSAIPARTYALTDSAGLLAATANGWVFDRRLVRRSGPSSVAVLYQLDDLRALAAADLAAALSDESELAPAQAVRVVVTDAAISPGASGAGQGIVQAQGVAVPKVDAIIRNSSGLLLESLRQRLLTIPGVSAVSIARRPAFWPFLPVWSGHTVVTLDIR